MCQVLTYVTAGGELPSSPEPLAPTPAAGLPNPRSHRWDYPLGQVSGRIPRTRAHLPTSQMLGPERVPNWLGSVLSQAQGALGSEPKGIPDSGFHLRDFSICQFLKLCSLTLCERTVILLDEPDKQVQLAVRHIHDVPHRSASFVIAR